MKLRRLVVHLALMGLVVALAACATRSRDTGASTAAGAATTAELGTASACKNPSYLAIKPQSLARMSEREFEYFIVTVKRLGDTQLEAFRQLDAACTLELQKQAAADRKKAEQEALAAAVYRWKRAPGIALSVFAVIGAILWRSVR